MLFRSEIISIWKKSSLWIVLKLVACELMLIFFMSGVPQGSVKHCNRQATIRSSNTFAGVLGRRKYDNNLKLNCPVDCYKWEPINEKCTS